MKIHDLILGAFFLLIIAGNSHAASFDCGKAVSEVEKLICGDEEHAQLDDGLSKTYRKVLRSAADPASLKREQTKWLREARDKCADSACLEKEYRNRLAALKKFLTATRAGEESANASEREAPAELKRLLRAGEDIKDFRKADLNGDGLSDYVFIVNHPEPDKDEDSSDDDDRS